MGAGCSVEWGALVSSKMVQTVDSVKEEKETRMVIDGYSYDVTAFKKKHPGGSVISFYDNMDATDVFTAFHMRSERAKKWLEVLPRRKVTAEDPDDSTTPLVKDFRKLEADLEKEGFFKPMWWMQMYRLFEVLFLQFLSLWVVQSYSWVVGGLIYGLVVARNGLLMHDMGHRAFMCDMYLDKAVHTIFFALGITGSASFWNNQHNKHHAATQELQHDTDLATLPVVAFHKEIAKDGSKAYLQFQWLVFIPAQLLLFYFWKFTHFRHAVRTKNWWEAGSIIFHNLLTLAICLHYGSGVRGWFVYQMIGYAWGGFYLATMFSMNHTHRPVAEKHAHRDWVERSIVYTTNVEPTLAARWMTGYLCYQIEHHLFPNMPHPRLPYCAPRVKALLEKHGVEYDCRSMRSAFSEVMVNLYRVGNEPLA